MPMIDKTISQLLGSAQVISWDGLSAGDVGKPVGVSSAHQKTVQFGGTFDGAVIYLEGSIDGENFFPLTDPQGDMLKKNVPSLETVQEYVNSVRPRVEGGSKLTLLTSHLLIKFER